MRVALLTLSRGDVSGGYRKYLQHVVPGLRAQPGVREVRVYAAPRVAALDPSFQAWPEAHPLAVAGWLRRQVAAWSADVVFIPSAFYLRCGEVPVVTMVRNMEPLERPFAGNRWSEGVRNLARRAVARRSCRLSSRVLAVSDHVRHHLLERWRLDPQRVGLVRHGVEEPEAGVRPAGLEGLGDRAFLFTAGSVRPARGLEDLLGAEIPARFAVAIAGARDPATEGYCRRLIATAERAGLADRVFWLGSLARAEMSWCYANAAAFVMTSRAEACPNSVLEALAHGCLSVSTDQPPMPEHFGHAAVYYRRGSVASLGAGLQTALGLPPAAAAELRERARGRAAQFTWEATSAATRRELQVALEQGWSGGRRAG